MHLRAKFPALVGGTRATRGTGGEAPVSGLDPPTDGSSSSAAGSLLQRALSASRARASVCEEERMSTDRIRYFFYEEKYCVYYVPSERG